MLSPLTSADYVRRDLSDIGSPGNERLLDTIDQQLAAGDGSAGLTELLARMGVKYVVVRNDLDRSALNGAWPARIHQALAESPGITRVARFGTFTGTFVPDDAVSHFDAPYPPVEIYQVAGAAPVATVQPAAGTLRVYGGPESLLTLAGENLLGRSGTRPVLLNDDGAGQPASGSVVSDSLRRRARSFGTIRGSYSPTLTATKPAATFEAAEDFTEPGWTRYQSVARYHRHRRRDRVVLGVRRGGHPGPVVQRAAAVRRGGREPVHPVGIGQLGRPGGPVDPAEVRRRRRPAHHQRRVRRQLRVRAAGDAGA